MTATTLPTSRSISSRAATGVALAAFLLGGALAAGVVALTDDATSPGPAGAVEQGVADEAGVARSGSAVLDPDRGSITAIDRAAARSGSAAFDPDRGSITAIDQRSTAASSGAQYSAGAAQNLWEGTAPAGSTAGAQYSAGAAQNLWEAEEDAGDE